MNWLLGSPWPILIIGVVIEVGLVVALINSGRGSLIAAIIGVAAATGGLLLVERLVVTEPEQVERELDGLSAALVRNDVPAVLEFIEPEATDVRSRAQQLLPTVVIQQARIGSDLSVKVDHHVRPHTAIASFTGTFRGKPAHGSASHDAFVSRFRVKFVKRGERWLINGAEQGGPNH